METLFARIKSNLNEAAISSADLIREAKQLEDKINTLKPIAAKLAEVVEQVSVAKAELAALTDKLKAAKDQHAHLLKTLQQV